MAERAVYKANIENEGQFFPQLDIVYSAMQGEPLKLWLFLPAKKEKTPLFVFVPGCAWTTPDIPKKTSLCAYLASRGIAVAAVSHRDRHKGYPAPACLLDVKTAIRFLRKNAEKYNIDADNIFIGGNSSGGNLSLLCGYTADEEKYKTSEYSEYSDRVKGIAALCPPTEVLRISMSFDNLSEEQSLLPGGVFSDTFCGKENSGRRRLFEEMSPLFAYDEAKEENKKLPLLLIHGNKDTVVDISHSERLYEKLAADSRAVRYIVLDGAEHVEGFFGDNVYSEIERFVLENARS